MTLTSKVIQIQPAGSTGVWNSFEYHMEDGWSGMQWTKNPKAFCNVGDVIEYERQADKNGNPKIKVVKKVAGPSVNTDAQRTDAQVKNTQINEERLNLDKEKQPLIVRQSAFKAACEYYANRDSTLLQLFDLCQMLTNYALTGNVPDFVDDGDVLPF